MSLKNSLQSLFRESGSLQDRLVTFESTNRVFLSLLSGLGQPSGEKSVGGRGPLPRSAEVSSPLQALWQHQCSLWSLHIPLSTTSYGELYACWNYRWVAVCRRPLRFCLRKTFLWFHSSFNSCFIFIPSILTISCQVERCSAAQVWPSAEPRWQVPVPEEGAGRTLWSIAGAITPGGDCWCHGQGKSSKR